MLGCLLVSRVGIPAPVRLPSTKNALYLLYGYIIHLLLIILLSYLDLTSRCPGLEQLDVSGCLLVSGVGVPAPARLPLHYLDMSDCSRIDDTRDGTYAIQYNTIQ